MTTRSDAAPILVLADAPEQRRRVADALASEWPVMGRSLAELREPQSLERARAAVVCLTGLDVETESALERLSEIPAGRAIVLLLEADKPGLDGLLAELRPEALLGLDAPPWLLRLCVRRALPGGEPLRRASHGAGSRFTLLGESPAIRNILERVDKVAPTGAAVLVEGETGTGKELVARTVHARSDRSAAPFVAVNCGSISASLLESELFGHERGAFTGAERARPGLFEQANGGTLFLDEIGEMPAPLQVKLLRAIDTGEIRRVGGHHTIAVDVRIVSATNRDLEQEVAEGRFRQDLLFRVNTVLLRVPPLRRRREDVPLLARHFASLLSQQGERPIVLEESLLDTLGRCDFPGNVRELRNSIERAVALAGVGDVITCADLPGSITAPSPGASGLDGTLSQRIEHVERKAIHEAIEECRGNRTRMAARLGLSRQGLRKKMRRLGID